MALVQSIKAMWRPYNMQKIKKRDNNGDAPLKND